MRKNENKTHNDDLWTIKDIAKRLKIGLRTAWRLDKDKKLPAPVMRKGRGELKLWDPADIELWIELNKPIHREDFERIKAERNEHGKTKI